MSDGRTHLKSSLILAASLSVAAVLSQDVRLLECAGGAILGVILSPDLDVDSGSIGNFVIRKRLGVFAERVWRGFWRGYSRSFKHRGFASHFPIYSTFLRLSYVYFWLIFVPHTVVKLLGLFNWGLTPVLSWWSIIFLSPLFFVGLASSDAIHWVLDTFVEKK